MDQIQQQPFDSIGFLQCLPGPCGLYRSDRLGTLAEGVAEKYFSLIESETKDLILGNVKLAEDRIPSALLVLQQNTDVMDKTTDVNENAEFMVDATMKTQTSSWSNENGNSSTTGSSTSTSMGGKKYYSGFEHDAVFYFEAEKP